MTRLGEHERGDGDHSGTAQRPAVRLCCAFSRLYFKYGRVITYWCVSAGPPSTGRARNGYICARNSAVRGNLDGSSGIEIGDVFALRTEDFEFGSRAMRDRRRLEMLDDGRA